MERELDRVQTLNNSFSDIVSNPRISEQANCDPISENINDAVIVMLPNMEITQAYSKQEKYATGNQNLIIPFRMQIKDKC